MTDSLAAAELVRRAAASRACEATAMNATSSRRCVFGVGGGWRWVDCLDVWVNVRDAMALGEGDVGIGAMVYGGTARFGLHLTGPHTQSSATHGKGACLLLLERQPCGAKTAKGFGLH